MQLLEVGVSSDAECRLRHVKMATIPRQQSTALDEEQPGGMPRRSSDQHLVRWHIDSLISNAFFDYIKVLCYGNIC